MCASKKGISAHQLWRMLGFGSYRTAWFMAHRIREGMRDEQCRAASVARTRWSKSTKPISAARKPTSTSPSAHRAGRAVRAKRRSLSLVERDGRVRSFHIANVTAETLAADHRRRKSARPSYLMTDEARSTRRSPRISPVTAPSTTAPKNTCAAAFWHTNTVENYFSILKRGIIGVYHHVSETHLYRYAAEFDFRYNRRSALGIDDTMRANAAIKGIAGKRLTYRQPHRKPKRPKPPKSLARPGVDYVTPVQLELPLKSGNSSYIW